MTQKVFWTDPYLSRLATRITQVEGDRILVAETIFYALSGGQESDEGTIGEQPVVEAHWQGRDIVYQLPPGHGLKCGDAVTIEIDWTRRYRLMRLHFAAEIVLELVYRALGSVEKVGAHIAADKARIDFAWPDNIAPLLPTIRNDANAIIAEDQVITSAFRDETSDARYWKIDAFPRVPCGGTHLKSTGEIGEIALKRKNIGKGKERIEIYLQDDLTQARPHDEVGGAT